MNESSSYYNFPSLGFAAPPHFLKKHPPTQGISAFVASLIMCKLWMKRNCKCWHWFVFFFVFFLHVTTGRAVVSAIASEKNSWWLECSPLWLVGLPHVAPSPSHAPKHMHGRWSETFLTFQFTSRASVPMCLFVQIVVACPCVAPW